MKYYDGMAGLDIRSNFDEFIDGSPMESPKGRPIVHRKITNTPCACWDESRGGGDPNCTYCDGEGFLWSEIFTVAYFASNFGNVTGAAPAVTRNADLQPLGFVDDSKCVAFMKADAFPDYSSYLNRSRRVYDAVYEVQLNPDGTVFYPLVRAAKWRVNILTPHHGDYGKVEYFELVLEKKNA